VNNKSPRQLSITLRLKRLPLAAARGRAGVGVRFTQHDTIIPDPGNSQSLNRFSYGYNNPVKFNDPSGHAADEGNDEGGSNDDYCGLYPTVPMCLREEYNNLSGSEPAY